MIDSLSFWLPEGEARGLESIQIYGASTFRGLYRNFRVIQKVDGLYCTGSLARYYQGNNIMPLSRRTVEDALNKLEQETGWNLKQASLKQVEIGYTLMVENSPALYLSTWGKMPRYVKQTYQKNELETVTYSINNLSFTGYNKKKQAKATGQEMPMLLLGHELIRLELKIKKGLAKRIGRPLVVWDLADRETYSSLVRKWHDFYFKIPKGRIPVLDASGGISPKDMDRALQVYGLEKVGKDNFLNQVSMLENSGKLGRVQAERVRKAYREIPKDKRFSEPDPLTAELDAGVRRVAYYAR